VVDALEVGLLAAVGVLVVVGEGGRWDRVMYVVMENAFGIRREIPGVFTAYVHSVPATGYTEVVKEF